VFFIKPGYSGAYEMLTVRTYPLTTALNIIAKPDWLEVRCVRTILGDHVLARTRSGWTHLDGSSLEPRQPPTSEQVRELLNDAFTANPQRYGKVARVEGTTAITDTGVTITMDWSRLSLSQKGSDTDRIDALYRIHYLQWTGFRSLDKVLGFTGIVLVMILAALGLRLAFRSYPANGKARRGTSG